MATRTTRAPKKANKAKAATKKVQPIPAGDPPIIQSRCKAASSTECGSREKPSPLLIFPGIPRSIPTQFPCDEISGTRAQRR
jgi:hypothetical protein